MNLKLSFGSLATKFPTMLLYSVYGLRNKSEIYSSKNLSK